MGGHTTLRPPPQHHYRSSSSSSSGSGSCDNVTIDSSSGISTGSSRVKNKDGRKDKKKGKFKNDDENNNIHDQDDEDDNTNDEDGDDMTNLATLASQAMIEATVMNEFNSIDETYRLQELKGK